MGKKNKLLKKDSRQIECVFVSKDGEETLGYIYKDDIEANGDCQIYCYESLCKKTQKKKLNYTSSKEEFEEAIRGRVELS